MKLQVGVKILIKNSNHEYLFLRRSGEVESGKGKIWDIPGGRISPDESLIDALRREIREETGLLLISEPSLIAAQDIFAPKKDLHVVRLTYKGTADGQVKLSEEHEDFSWMDKSTVLASDSDLDPYLLDLL